MNDRRVIDEIIVGKRHRRDLGDIASLAKSIDAHGLLHPIVVTCDGRLIAGERRLAPRIGSRPQTDSGQGRRSRRDRARRAGREHRSEGLCADRDRGDPPDARADRKGGGEEAAGRQRDLVETFHEVPRGKRPATRSAPSPASAAARSRRSRRWSLRPKPSRRSSASCRGYGSSRPR